MWIWLTTSLVENTMVCSPALLVIRLYFHILLFNQTIHFPSIPLSILEMTIDLPNLKQLYLNKNDMENITVGKVHFWLLCWQCLTSCVSCTALYFSREQEMVSAPASWILFVFNSWMWPTLCAQGNPKDLEDVSLQETGLLYRSCPWKRISWTHYQCCPVNCRHSSFCTWTKT